MKYVGYYDTEKARRDMSLAAVNKMNYICSVINRIGHRVSIVACGMTAAFEKKACKEKVFDETEVLFFKTKKIPTNIASKVTERVRRNITLFSYLMKNTKKNEQVIVYHSLGIMRCVYFAKRLKRFKLILEVEEFYNDVFLESKTSRRMEQKFIACADKYIFPTELLNEKFNKQNKPYTVIHGTYQVEPKREETFGDGKIHVVYAGTFDPRKGGGVAAAATEWLSKEYHVHILGFGSDSDTANIKKLIKETNEKSEAIVTYDGLLSGEEYIKFLQKCHIGLSTQNPDADFNATSFPSKILSYMANGLRVVTIRIPAIESSAVNSDIYYYKNQTPKDIAKAIMAIDLSNGCDGRKKIAELDKKFCEDLKNLLEE